MTPSDLVLALISFTLGLAPDLAVIEGLAEEHATRLLALPGGEKHMIEIEFLDEGNSLQRFFRIGTDPRMMVQPIEVNREPGLENDAPRKWEHGGINH